MTKAKMYLCLNYLTSPHNSCIKNETRVREAEGIFLIGKMAQIGKEINIERKKW
jgi:hypothetical protein